MSVEARRWAGTQTVGDPTGKAVLFALSDYADKEGYCYPGITKIAASLECSERTIIRKIKLLESLGLVVKERRQNRGSRTSNGYQLSMAEKSESQCDSVSYDSLSCDSVSSQCDSLSLANVTACHFPIRKNRQYEPSEEPSDISGSDVGNAGGKSSGQPPLLPVSGGANRTAAGPPTKCAGEAGEISAAVDAWNKLALEIEHPTVMKLTAKRKAKLKARLADCGGLEGWHAALDKIRETPFCRGEGRQGWRMDFDALCQEDKFTRLMEGSYGSKDHTTTGEFFDRRRGSVQDQWLRTFFEVGAERSGMG